MTRRWASSRCCRAFCDVTARAFSISIAAMICKLLARYCSRSRMSPNAGSRKRERESLLKRTEDSLHQKEVLLPEMQHRVGHVLVSYETSGSNWRLSVSDNGVGKQ